MENLIRLVEAAVRLASEGHSVSGITGGVKGLSGASDTRHRAMADGARDLHLLARGRATKGVRALSPLDRLGSVEAAIAAYSAFQAAASNMVRNAMVGSGRGSEPTPG